MTIYQSPRISFEQREVRAARTPTSENWKTGAILNANTGEGNVLVHVQNTAELIDKFGKPNDYNRTAWFNCYNYLQYGTQLYVVRPVSQDAQNPLIKFEKPSAGSTAMSIASAGLTPTSYGFYNTELAEYSLDNGYSISTASTYTAKLSVINRSVTTETDVAVVICSESAQWTLPISYEEIDAVYNKTSNPPSSPVNEQAIVVAPDEYTITANIQTATTSTIVVNISGTDTTLTCPTGKTILQVRGKFVPVTSQLTIKITAGGSTTYTCASTLSSITAITSITSMYYYDALNNRTIVLVDQAIDTGITTNNIVYYLQSKPTGMAYDNSNLYQIYEYDAASATWSKQTHTAAYSFYMQSDGYKYTFDSSQSTNALRLVKTADKYLGVDSNSDGVAEYGNKKIYESKMYNTNNTLKSFSDFFSNKPNFANKEFVMLVFKQDDNDDLYYFEEQHKLSYLSTAKDNAGNTMYADKKILSDSKLIYCKVNTATGAGSYSWNLNTNANKYYYRGNSAYDPTNTAAKTGLAIESLTLTDTSVTNYGAITSAGTISTSDMYTAADIFKSSETDVQILMGFRFYDQNVSAWTMNKLAEIAKEREDLWTIICPENENWFIGQKKSTIATNLVNNFGTQRDNPLGGEFTEMNSFVSTYANMKQQYDQFQKKNIWASLTGDIAGLVTRIDALLGVWNSPAGIERSALRNARKLAWNPNMEQKDLLANNRINAVVQKTSTNVSYINDIWTSIVEDSIYQDVNVRLLTLEIINFCKDLLEPSLYQFNDAFERARIVNILTPKFEYILQKRGLDKYSIICDETNNTAEKMNDNTMVVDIKFRPNKVVKYINVILTAYEFGTNFDLAVFESDF